MFAENPATPDIYTIDTSRPIDGTSSHGDEGAALATARRVSRHGGHARITQRDPTTGVEKEKRVYTPYEAAMDDLADPATP
ncbi:MAG: hypothetical protein WCE30_07875 [Mycobacterium sp.]